LNGSATDLFGYYTVTSIRSGDTSDPPVSPDRISVNERLVKEFDPTANSWWLIDLLTDTIA